MEIFFFSSTIPINFETKRKNKQTHKTSTDFFFENKFNRSTNNQKKAIHQNSLNERFLTYWDIQKKIKLRRTKQKVEYYTVIIQLTLSYSTLSYSNLYHSNISIIRTNSKSPNQIELTESLVHIKQESTEKEKGQSKKNKKIKFSYLHQSRCVQNLRCASSPGVSPSKQ